MRKFNTKLIVRATIIFISFQLFTLSSNAQLNSINIGSSQQSVNTSTTFNAWKVTNMSETMQNAVCVGNSNGWDCLNSANQIAPVVLNNDAAIVSYTDLANNSWPTGGGIFTTYLSCFPVNTIFTTTVPVNVFDNYTMTLSRSFFVCSQTKEQVSLNIKISADNSVLSVILDAGSANEVQLLSSPVADAMTNPVAITTAPLNLTGGLHTISVKCSNYQETTATARLCSIAGKVLQLNPFGVAIAGNITAANNVLLNKNSAVVSSVSDPTSNCAGNIVTASFAVTDNSQTNSWYKYRQSIDGGINYTDISTPAQAIFVGNSYTLSYNIGVASSSLNGYKYRLAVATSQSGLVAPECLSVNDFTLNVFECGPLPIQLASFTGKYAEGKLLLNWQTNQELNSDRFELMRSTNGVDFIKVASIKGAGNSITIRNYSYQDNISGITGNVVYYRLQQIEINGKASVSAIVKLSLGSKTKFELFPNPFTNSFTVSFSAVKSSIATLRIQNSAGNLVYSKSITVTKGNNSVVMNSLPAMGSGVYYFSVVNEELNFNGKLQKL